jgi:hypothetical protein
MTRHMASHLEHDVFLTNYQLRRIMVYFVQRMRVAAHFFLCIQTFIPPKGNAFVCYILDSY